MNIIVSRPADNQDLERVFRFLYRIWIKECGRELPGTNHTREQIRDDLDNWASHFVAVNDQGQIVGCIRVNRLSKGQPDHLLAEGLGLKDMIGLFSPESIAFISHLAVLPAFRGGTVISLLLTEMFRYFIETGVSVALCYCRLGMVNLFHRLGMRPYRPNFHCNGKMQVPLVGCINDKDYLARTGSPLRMLLPESCDDGGSVAAALAGSYPMFKAPDLSPITNRNLWAQLAHASPFPETEPGKKLLQNVPAEILENLLPQFPKVSLSQNETIEIGSEWEAAMGILVEGALGVGVGKTADPHFIYVIRPGQPFGELITLARIQTDTVIIALEDSQVILLPERLFDRLVKTEPETAIHLYKNLLAILAHRTAAANTALSDHLEKMDSRTKVLRPARHKAQSIRTTLERGKAWSSTTENQCRTESYHFDTLADPDGELKRLTCQASIAEALELDRLKEIGLSNGDRIMDLGSGPGITSGILARHFQDSKIYGVEPEEQLRCKARTYARQSCAGNCCFLEGTAQNIPLPDAAMDFSYARLLFQHIPDPMTCLGEMKRVTRPGGIVCVLDVDDGTIFIHPHFPEWKDIEQRVARAQGECGGDRHVGRKLLGYYEALGFDQPQLDIVPVTTQMLGPELFFHIVFGFKQQHLKRCRDWDDATEAVFHRLGRTLMQKGAFASENIFLAHGTVPEA